MKNSFNKMDFIDKKEKLADMIENYISEKIKSEELNDFLEKLSADEDIKKKELLINIITELKQYLSELSRKELKQRILMIRSYLE